MKGAESKRDFGPAYLISIEAISCLLFCGIILCMNIRILTNKISANDLKDFSKNWYPNFLKGCVDLELRKVAIGGDYHIESAQVLVNEGGNGEYIWGFNIRFKDDGINIIEFDSMVNIKPKINNTRTILSEDLKNEISELINEYLNL